MRELDAAPWWLRERGRARWRVVDVVAYLIAPALVALPFTATVVGVWARQYAEGVCGCP